MTTGRRRSPRDTAAAHATERPNNAPPSPKSPADRVAGLWCLAVRHAPLVLLAASAGVLGAAFASQYLGGLQPCILCLYQRRPYAIVIGLAAVAALLPAGGRGGHLRIGLLGLSSVALLANVGIAGFHVGVEQTWWPGPAQCGGAIGSGPISVEDLMSTPIVRCDQPAWTLLGISMAGYNVALSLGLALFAAVATRSAVRGRSGDRQT